MKKYIKNIGKLILMIMILFAGSSQLLAKTYQKVTGIVMNGDKTPAVNLIVTETKSGAIATTNNRGKFSIDNVQGDVLTIKKGEDIIKQIQVDSSYVEIFLDRLFEDEQVAVAFGVQKRSELTGAVDLINYDDIDNMSVTNTHHVTQGQFAGLTARLDGGEPGSNGMTFLVRGRGSFNANKPLLLIDGFEGDFGHLSPNEIESIAVLKDAVSTAMYGMRGANGVILVTTKKGFEGKTKFTVSGETGIMKPTELPNFVNANQYASLVNQTMMNEGLLPRYTNEQLQAYQAGNDPYNNPDIDWMDEMLRSSAMYYNASAQARGGSDRLKFFVMGSYMYTDGLLDHTEENSDYSTQTKFGRINFRSNVEVKVNENTDFAVGIGGRLEDRDDPQVGVGSFMDNLYATPANRYVMYNEDGSFGGTDKYRNNPMAQMVGKGHQEAHNRTFNVDLKINHKMDYLLSGLSAGLDVSFRNYFSVVEKFKASYAVYEKEGFATDENGVEMPVYHQYGTESPRENDKRGKSQDHSNIYRAYVEYNRSVNESDLSAKIIYQGERYVKENDGEPYLYKGLSARFKYGYKKKYFAELTASYNGSNAYNPDDQYGFFPALGVSWILSNEDFIKENSAINFMKLRASFGKTGSDLLDGYRRFMYLLNYNAGDDKYRFGTNKLTTYDGLSEQDIANPDAKWEDSYMANIGVDLRFLTNWNLTADAFYERRTDILQSLDNVTSDMIGITLPRINFGEVENKGVEFTLAYKNQVTDKLFFGFRGNFGYAKNEIKEYYEGDNVITPRIGNSVGQTYGYIADGFYVDAKDIANSPVNTFDKVQAGDVKYRDISGPNGTPDGKIDNYDESAIGYQNIPEVHFGFQFDLAYGNFYLNAMFDGVANRDIMMDDNDIYRPLRSGYDNISEFAANHHWTPETGNSALLPRLTVKDNYNNYKQSTLYQVNGNYIRLRSAELGYKIPRKLLNNLKIADAKLFVRGYNIFSIDNAKGVDPEIQKGYPLLKSYNMGVKVQF